MLSLDLFDSRYERDLREGAVDDLEARRIDDLNDRMQDLLARAREPAYQANPGALAALKKQFQQVKDERDSYYKVREAGIPGNVPVEKIPGKEDLLKGRGRSYYEDQKKNTKQVDEYISMGSDKNFVEADPYKNYRIYVRKKPFGTTGMYTAHTEIDRKEFMGKGPSQEEAVQDIRDRIDFVLNAQRKVTGSSTIDFNVKFATDLLADPKQTFYAKLENINGEPKLVIASADVASDPELLAAGDFKRSALRNQPDDQGRATPLPGIPLTAKGLRSGDWIANGRYTVGKETQDRDGNRVFDLTYHSTAHTKSDKLRLNQPAFTLGTAREVDEHGGGIGPRQHWQDLMQEGQPLELMNRYLAIDAENDVDAVRQAIQAISKDPNVSDASKIRLLGQLGMIIRRYRLPIGRAYYQFMQQYMEEQSVTETVVDVRAGMARIYRRLAPKIEHYKDSFLAGQLYDELENYAELHGAESEFKQMMNGARNRAHMEYDTNPGGFQNWFWFLPFEDNDVAEAISKKDLVGRLQKDLPKVTDPKNKDARPVAWTGPGKDDYGYTGYQGHGMPTDKAERARIRADKKKGMAEGSLEEIDRRGFLKGMGAAAVAGTGGVAVGVRKISDNRVSEALGNIYGFLDAINGKDPESYKTIVNTRNWLDQYEKRLPRVFSKDWIGDDWFKHGLDDGKHKFQTEFPNGLQKPADREKFNTILQVYKEHFYRAALSSMEDFKESVKQGVAEGTDDVKKRMSKLEALALAANRAGDDAKCKMYQQKIQSLKQKLSNMEEGYVSTIGPDVAPLPPEKQWKIQVRQLIADYIKNPQGLYNLVKQKGANSAEAAAYKFIMHPAGKIALPPDAVTFEGWSDAMVAQRTGGPRTPYSVYVKGKKWKDFENDDHAEAVANKLKAKFKADGRDPETVTIAPTDYNQPIKEEQDTSGVESAIIRRIMVAHIDLLRQFGPDKVMQAAEEVAYNVGDVDEIGTSDVSAYVQQVKQILGAVA